MGQQECWGPVPAMLPDVVVYPEGTTKIVYQGALLVFCASLTTLGVVACDSDDNDTVAVVSGTDDGDGTGETVDSSDEGSTR